MSFPQPKRAVFAPTPEASDSVSEIKDSDHIRHAQFSSFTSGAAPVTHLEVKPWAHFVAGA